MSAFATFFNSTSEMDLNLVFLCHKTVDIHSVFLLLLVSNIIVAD